MTALPDCTDHLSPGAGADTRNYRVDFAKVADDPSRRVNRDDRGRGDRPARRSPIGSTA